MRANAYYLVYGPAYLDIVVDIDGPLVSDIRFDQSLPATHATERTDGRVMLLGDSGDQLSVRLPAPAHAVAATYHLAEPVFGRLFGRETSRTVVGHYLATDVHAQVGGMGAGYALALNGRLRTPLGGDEAGREVLQQLLMHRVHALPHYLPHCSSDTSLVLLSPQGDKLAVGVRQAMVRWRATREDRSLVRNASALVCCGAPNALTAEILSWQPDLPVMCAPAMRNVCDTQLPLAELAPRIHYLALNALEWQHLPHKEECLRQIPVISVTDGPRGSRILLRGGQEYPVPVVPCAAEPLNTNRAGETYGSTFFKVLLHSDPSFVQRRQVDAELAERAGYLASVQASRQLAISGFAFPPDDWMAT